MSGNGVVGYFEREEIKILVFVLRALERGDHPTGAVRRPEWTTLRAKVQKLEVKLEAKLDRPTTLDQKRQAGERIGEIPYGKRLAEDGKHLLDDAQEQQTIERVVALRRRGLTYRKIAEVLWAAGVTPRKGTRWHPQTLARIVTRYDPPPETPW